MSRYRLPSPRRVSTRLAVLVACTAALSGCATDRPLPLAPAAPPLSTAVLEHELHIPLAGSFENPCNGELITFEGTGHLRVTETFQRDGLPYHFVFHFNSRVTATGTSGTTYVGAETDTYQTNTRPGDVGEINEAFTLTLISRGSAPNLILKFGFHLTVNQNGVETVRIVRESAECRG